MVYTYQPKDSFNVNWSSWLVGRTGNVNNIISDWTIISNMRDVDTILNILYLFWCRTCKFRNTRHVRFYPQWSWPLVLTWNSWSLAGWVVYQGSFLSISAYILSMTGSCSMLKMFFHHVHTHTIWFLSWIDHCYHISIKLQLLQMHEHSIIFWRKILVFAKVQWWILVDHD